MVVRKQGGKVCANIYALDVGCDDVFVAISDGRGDKHGGDAFSFFTPVIEKRGLGFDWQGNGGAALEYVAEKIVR